jgi:predicted PurR-regulated permease PerM
VDDQERDDEGWDRRRRNAEELRNYLRLFSIALGIVVAVLLTVVLEELAAVLQPLAVALFLAYLIYPGVRFLVRRRVPRSIAYVISVLIIVTIVYVVGELVASNVQRFLDNLPSYKDNLSGIEETVTDLGHKLRLLPRTEDFRLDSVLERMPQDAVAQILGGGTTFFLGFVGNLFVIAFFLVFILLEVQRLPERVELAYGKARAAGILSVLTAINASVERYIGLKVLVSAVTGLLGGAIMVAFGVDFWFLLGVLTFLLNFIPYLGSIIATFAPMLLALLQFDSAWSAVWLGLALSSVQLSVGNLIEPALQGRSLNISPLLILVALAFWGWLWGITGMVLAVPIVVSVRIALEHIPRTRPFSILMSNVTHRDLRETKHLEGLSEHDD